MGLTNIFLIGLLAATTAVASPTKRGIVSGMGGKDKVVAYWGNTGAAGGNMDISDLCQNEAIDKVILSFLNVFPEQNKAYPGNGNLNLAGSCGWVPTPKDFPAPDHSDTGLIYCPDVKTGLDICKANKKEVLLSLGGALPGGQQFSSEQAAKDFANWLWLHFGANYPSGTDRPFLDFVIDGIDLDIEAGLDAAIGQKYFSDFIDQIRVASGYTWKIGAAPQCVNPDSNMGTYIQTSWIDYIFVQLYNTDKCSARNQVDSPAADSNTFADWLSQSYINPAIEVYAGLPASSLASTNTDTGAKYFLTPDEVRQLYTQFKDDFRLGGISLWDASFDNLNAICGHPYSYWVKKAIKQANAGDTTPILPNFPACPVSSSSSSVRPSTSSAAISSSSSVAPSTSSARPSSSSAAASSHAISSVPTSSHASFSDGASDITSSSSFLPPFPSHGPFFNSSSSVYSGHGGSGPHASTSLSYGAVPVPTKSYGGGYGSGPSKSYDAGGDDHPVVTSSIKTYGGAHGNGGHSGRPTATKTSTTTYVDVCETGLTTATATYTRTCYDGEDDSDWAHTGVPDGWFVTVTEYVPYNGAKPTTITVTRPHTVTIPKATPAKPTDAPYVKPGYNGGNAKPVSTMVVVVTPVPVAEYSAYIAAKPAASAPADGSYVVKPVYDSGAKAQSSAIAKPVTGYSPSKVADSWPIGAQPTGTKAGSYAPQFTGAASRAQVGLSLLAGLAVAALAAF